MAIADPIRRAVPALPSLRQLLEQRKEELGLIAGRLEARLAEDEVRNQELMRQYDDLSVIWDQMLQSAGSFGAEELRSTSSGLSEVKGELAVLDERRAGLSSWVADLRNEQEILLEIIHVVDELPHNEVGEVDEDVSGRGKNSRSRLFRVVEEERLRIARDMHDGPAQALANLVLQAEILSRLMEKDPQLVLNELSEFKLRVREVLDDTRRMIFDLRPMTLDDLGLVPTLNKFLEDYEKRHGIKTQLLVVGEAVRMKRDLESTVFRVIQESMNNIWKHANATAVEIDIRFTDSSIFVAVKDNGSGFDVAASQASIDPTKHLGMTSMQERVDQERGTLELYSQIGKGTEVRLKFPL
jgi:two-component system sensor histidine kinase DegS